MSFSAKLPIVHSSADKMSEGKCPFLFLIDPIAFQPQARVSPYEQNAGCWISLKMKVFHNILTFTALKRTEF